MSRSVSSSFNNLNEDDMDDVSDFNQPVVSAPINSLDKSYKSDPKYKKYKATLEKILDTFEVEDWHDIIPFLGKIYKTIVHYPQFPNVPRKAEISKRIAQALNPNLPAGVHQKALDVCSVLFERIGSEKLFLKLPNYSYAIFSFFEFASMSVKPFILNLYDRFYIPLGRRLRICLKDFILGILPALEEEGNEFFEKTMQLLDTLKASVGEEYFFTAFWYCLLNNARHRMAAVNYLSKRTPNVGNKSVSGTLSGPIAEFLGRNREVVVKALSASLADSKLLVIRNILEIIVNCFPLEGDVFTDEEYLEIMEAVLATLLRREMSLTRRVYSWIIKPAPISASATSSQIMSGADASTSSNIVNAKSLRILKECIKKMLNDITDYNRDISDCIKPFKIIISLQDRSEIGSLIFNDLLLDVVYSLQKKHAAKTPNFGELMQYANMFIETVDSFNIWKWLYASLKKHYIAQTEEDCLVLSLIVFVLENFKIFEDDIFRYHLPLLSVYLLEVIITSFDKIQVQNLPVQLQIYRLIIAKIPDRIHGNNVSSSTVTTPLAGGASNVPPSSSVVAMEPIIEGSIQLPSPLDHNNRRFVAGTDIVEYIQSFYNEEMIDGNGHYTVPSLRGDLLIEENVLRIQRIIELFLNHYVLVESNMSTAGNKISEKETHQKRIKSYQLLLACYEKYISLIGRPSNSTTKVSKGPNEGSIASPTNADGIHCDLDSINFTYFFDRWSKTFFPPFYRSVSNINELIKAVSKNASSSMTSPAADLTRYSSDWLTQLISSCYQAEDFQIIQMSITTLTNLRKCHPLFKMEFQRKIPCFALMVKKLWSLLQNKNSMIHLRVCVLIWELQSVSLPEELDSVIAGLLSSPADDEREENFKKFSTFWMISDTIPCPTTSLTQPLFLMVGGIEDSNPHVKRVAETWIRCCVRNFIRIVDPFIILLLTNMMKTTTVKRDVFGDQLEFPVYERAFNVSQVHFALSSLLSICRLGGKGLFLSLREEFVSSPGSIFHAVRSSNCIRLDENGEISYANLFLQIVYSFATTDTPDNLTSSSSDNGISSRFNTVVETIHNEATELLIIFVLQESFVSLRDMLNIRDRILEKLVLTIQSNELEYQLRLLMLLQCIIALTNRPQSEIMQQQRQTRVSSVARRSLAERIRLNAIHKRRNTSSVNTRNRTNSQEVTSPVGIPGFPDFKRIGSNPFFFKAIMCAFTTESNGILCDHWIDFALSIVPFIYDPYRRLIAPLISTLCDLVNSTIAEIKESFELQLSLSDIDGNAMVKMMDFSTYMSCIHRIFIFCFNQQDVYLGNTNTSNNNNNGNNNSGNINSSGGSASNKIIDSTTIAGNSSSITDNVNSLAMDDSSSIMSGTGQQRLSQGSSANGGVNATTEPSYRKRMVSSMGLRIIPDFVRDIFNTALLGDYQVAEPVAEDVFRLLTTVVESYDSTWLLYDTFLTKFTNQLVVDHISQQIIMIRNYIQTSLMEMFEINPQIVLESLTESWARRREVANHSVEILYIVTKANVEECVSILLAITRAKATNLPGGGDKSSTPLTLLFPSNHANNASSTSLHVNVTSYLYSCLTDSDLIQCITELFEEFLMPHQALVMWPQISLLIRDYVNSASSNKFAFLSLTSLVHTINQLMVGTSVAAGVLPGGANVSSGNLSSNNALNSSSNSNSGGPLDEGEKLMKDQLDCYVRLIDYCCMISGRNFESGLFSNTRRNFAAEGSAFDAEVESLSNSLGNTALFNGSASSASTNANNNGSNAGGGHGDSTSVNKRLKEDVYVLDCIDYIVKTVLPSLRLSSLDTDRLLVITNSIYQNIVFPYLRVKSNAASSYQMQVHEGCLTALSHFSTMPITLKVWKKEVWEYFCDPKFFVNVSQGRELVTHWRKIIQCIAYHDQDRFGELLNKIVFSNAPTLFQAKEVEENNRNNWIRKIALLLIIGNEDQYVRFLPELEAKVTEFFRLSRFVCYGDGFFLMRAIFVRFKRESLTRFFPGSFAVLLTILKNLIHKSTNSNSNNSGNGSEPLLENTIRKEELKVYLEACKFLDLFLALPYDECKSMRWIFVADSPHLFDNNNNDNNVSSEGGVGGSTSILDSRDAAQGGVAILERVKRRFLTEYPQLTSTSSNVLKPYYTSLDRQGLFHKPMLINVSSISSPLELGPFFRDISNVLHSICIARSALDFNAIDEVYLSEIVMNQWMNSATDNN